MMDHPEDLKLNRIHLWTDEKKSHKRSCTGLFIWLETWVGLTLIWDVPPSCPAAQVCQFPISPGEEGRGLNSQNQSQSNRGSPGDVSPCRSPINHPILKQLTPHLHRWLINLDKKQRVGCLDNFWLEVMLCLIGETFDDHRDELYKNRSSWKIGSRILHS